MEIAFHILIILSILLFLYYGIDCLRSDAMRLEFERFGLSRFRTMVGWLEVLGAVGLLVGYLVPVFHSISSGGLTLLMLLGVVTRIRVGDPVVEMLPALMLMFVNAFVLLVSVGVLG